MATLSVCMIVKNEEKHLERCLTSVKDVADEIVIVDTGSEDNTLSIAEAFNSSIFHFKWNNDFSSARNFSLSKCQSDLILYLDADEELSPDSVEEVNRIKKIDPAGVYCKVISPGTSTTSGSIFRYPRLFANAPGVQFSGKVHEQVIDSLKRIGLPIIESNIEIIHHGYTIDDEELKKKKERNLSLLQSTVSKKPTVYDRLKLIQTLISLKRLEDAEVELNKLILSKNILGENLGLAFYYLASIKFEQGDLSLSLKYGLKALPKLANKPELNYLVYLIYLRLNNFTEAFQYLNLSIKLNLQLLDNSLAFNNENILDQLDLYLRAVNLSYKLNDIEKAEELIEQLSEYLSFKKNFNKDLFLSEIKSLLLGFECSPEAVEMIYSNFDSKHLLQIIDITKNCDQNDKLINIFEKLLVKYPNSATLYKNLALLYANSDQLKSVDLLTRSLEIEKEAQAYIHLISVYLSLNEQKKAAEIFYQLKHEFDKNIQIRQKINILEQKLSPILDLEAV